MPLFIQIAWQRFFYLWTHRGSPSLQQARPLNDLFSKIWADKHGIIRGKPVMLIYRMNHAAGAEGLDAVVDESLLAAELKKAGLTLMREGEENDLNCVRG